MLQTRPLQELLSQALSPTTHTAVLATPQGTLVAHSLLSQPSASFQETEARRRHARDLAAIVPVIWKSYATVKNVNDLFEAPDGTPSDGEGKEGLLWLSIECEVQSDPILILSLT
jgi:hypothetical protein